KVRAESEFQKLPIIVFSNTYLTNLVQEAWKAGATKCLSKANCSPKQLLEVVRNTLNGGPVSEASEVQPSSTSKVAGAQGSSEASAAAAATGPGPTTSEKWDADSQSELRDSFLASTPETLTSLRGMLQATIKSSDESERRKQIQEM